LHGCGLHNSNLWEIISGKCQLSVLRTFAPVGKPLGFNDEYIYYEFCIIVLPVGKTRNINVIVNGFMNLLFFSVETVQQ
jgi:hypothetical protein